MAVAQASVPYFDMGRVVKRTFSVIGHNLSTFALLSLIVAIPTAIINWRLTFLPPEVLSRGPFALYSNPFFLITQILSFFSLFVLQASIIHATIVYLDGRAVKLNDSLRVALAVLLQLLAITILTYAGVMIGLALLAVPGLMLLVMWSMVVPACVVDRTGILHAFGRSRELTKGHRWAIFGLLVAYFLIMFVIGFTFAWLNGINIFSAKPEEIAVALRPTLFRSVINVISSMVTSTISTTLIASIYYELR